MHEIDEVKFIRSRAMDDMVAHAFFTRSKGVSPPPFDSLNFDSRGADSVENVEENVRLASIACDADLTRLTLVNQAHGSLVHVADENDVGLKWTQRPEADAIITNKPNLPIGVLTADCLPMLIHDPRRRAIAVVHAGWKGTLHKISQKTIEAMEKKYGTNPEDVNVAMGPHIRPCCYEVKDDLYDAFMATGARCATYFLRSEGLRLDLARANTAQLQEAGVKTSSIDKDALCTSCQAGFFSYRRDTGNTGRQLSFIMLKGRP